MDHSGIFGASVYGVGTYVRIGDNQGFENDYRRNNRVVNRMADTELFGISEQLNDLISRQAALGALGERPVVWSDNDDYTLGARNQYDMDRLALETVPSAQRWIPCSECKKRCEKWEHLKT